MIIYIEISRTLLIFHEEFSEHLQAKDYEFSYGMKCYKLQIKKRQKRKDKKKNKTKQQQSEPVVFWPMYILRDVKLDLFFSFIILKSK